MTAQSLYIGQRVTWADRAGEVVFIPVQPNPFVLVWPDDRRWDAGEWGPGRGEVRINVRTLRAA